MEILDQAYLTDLCIRAKQGNSNAFAELYAATCRRQYDYIFRTLRDREEALAVLREVYTAVLPALPSLQNPSLFTIWLSRFSFRFCYEARYRDAGDRHLEEESMQIQGMQVTLDEVLRLPLAEAQVCLMHGYQGLPLADICEILNMSRRLVRYSLRAGCRHLRKRLA